MPREEIQGIVEQALQDFAERMLWAHHYLLIDFDDQTHARFGKAVERVYDQVKERAGKRSVQTNLHPQLEVSRRRICRAG